MVLSESDVAEPVVPFIVGRDVGARPYLLGHATAQRFGLAQPAGDLDAFTENMYVCDIMSVSKVM